MELRDRAWELQVQPPTGSTLTYTGMRMAFDVRSGREATSQSCTVTVWNPAKGLVDALQAGAFVRVLAGYQGAPVKLAQGDVVRSSVQDLRRSVDPRVQWQVSVSKRMEPVVSSSWDGPVKVSRVIGDIIEQIGAAPDVIELGEDVEIQRGYVAQGSARQVFDDLAASTGSVWQWVGDSAIQFRPAEAPAIVSVDRWNVGSGLLEISGPAGGRAVKATALLRPSIQPGSLVELDDDAYSGLVVVKEVGHRGDSEGDVWYTDIEAVPHAA